MRDYIGDHLRIDGRMICYRLVTATDYLQAKGWTTEQINQFAEDRYRAYDTINQVMALKQSCFLLRRTGYSCGSLADSLFSLKTRLIRELQDLHDFDFDDDFVERNGQPEKHCKACGKVMVVIDGQSRHGTHYSFDAPSDGDHKAVA